MTTTEKNAEARKEPKTGLTDQPRQDNSLRLDRILRCVLECNHDIINNIDVKAKRRNPLSRVSTELCVHLQCIKSNLRDKLLA